MTDPHSTNTAPPPLPQGAIGNAEGHGHGMSRNRVPKDNKGLPHEEKRDATQPYAREVDDYSGGAARAPEEPEDRTNRQPRESD